MPGYGRMLPHQRRGVGRWPRCGRQPPHLRDSSFWSKSRAQRSVGGCRFLDVLDVLPVHRACGKSAHRSSPRPACTPFLELTLARILTSMSTSDACTRLHTMCLWLHLVLSFSRLVGRHLILPAPPLLHRPPQGTPTAMLHSVLAGSRIAGCVHQPLSPSGCAACWLPPASISPHHPRNHHSLLFLHHDNVVGCAEVELARPHTHPCLHRPALPRAGRTR